MKLSREDGFAALRIWANEQRELQTPYYFKRLEREKLRQRTKWLKIYKERWENMFGDGI